MIPVHFVLLSEQGKVTRIDHPDPLYCYLEAIVLFSVPGLADGPKWTRPPPTPLGVPLKCPFSNLTPAHPLLCRCISDKHSTALSDRPYEISLPPFFGSADYLFTRPPGQMVAVTRLAFRFLIP